MKIIFNIGLSVFLIALISGCDYEPTEDPESSDGSITPNAEFIIQNDHLITVESNIISVSSLTDPDNPTLIQTYTSSDNRTVETLYPYKTNMLMVGTKQGTYFKDHTTPGTLSDVVFSELFTSCDAVVTSGNFLYMTLNSDGLCTETNNTSGEDELVIYNILLIDQPSLISSISIDKPYGLSVSGNNLFVCYENGVLEFDISNPSIPTQTGDYSQPCERIIANTDPMVLTDNSGVRLVEYAAPGLTELSIIRKGE